MKHYLRQSRKSSLVNESIKWGGDDGKKCFKSDEKSFKDWTSFEMMVVNRTLFVTLISFFLLSSSVQEYVVQQFDARNFRSFFHFLFSYEKNVHMLIRYEFLWRKEILGLKFFTFLGPKYKNKKVTPLTLIHTHIGWGWLIHEDWTISRFRFLFDENRLLLHFFCLVGVRVRWLRGWGESQRSGSSSMMREEWMVKKIV